MCMSAREGNIGTKVRTFRLRESLDDVLREEADRQSITVSALLSQMVARYAAAERFFARYDALTIERKTFASILDDLTDEKVAKLGDLAGSRSLRSGLAIRGMNVNRENIRFVVEEVYGLYSGWFTPNFFERNGFSVYHLRHDLGMKWSIFLERYMVNMFKSLMGLEVKSEKGYDYVTISIPDKKESRSGKN
jgi:hypothetical protein